MSGAAQYLLALYIVEQRSDPPVSSGDVAALVGRSQATATQMLQGLESDGLATYEPYEGAALTEAGTTGRRPSTRPTSLSPGSSGASSI